MTNPNRTEVVCVLDRSGSMSNIWSDAIAVGGSLGIHANLCANIEATSKGMSSSYGAYSTRAREVKTRGAAFFLSNVDDLRSTQDIVDEEMEMDLEKDED